MSRNLYKRFIHGSLVDSVDVGRRERFSRLLEKRLQKFR